MLFVLIFIVGMIAFISAITLIKPGGRVKTKWIDQQRKLREAQDR
jgi:hypothetical protein